MPASVIANDVQGPFNAGANTYDYYGAAMEIAGQVYRGASDKGCDIASSIWFHIRPVENRFIAKFGSKMPRRQLMMECAAVILHDFGELKKTVDGKRAYIFTREEWIGILQTYNLPDHFINTIDALTRRENEAYLEYIQRLAGDPVALRIKLHADLPENRSADRAAITKEAPSQEFLEKKAYLYEMTELYLSAREQNVIGDISVAEYIMMTAGVPKELKNAQVLRRHSTMGATIPSLAAPSGDWLTRRKVFRGTGLLAALMLKRPFAP